MMQDTAPHIPVMLDEVLTALAPVAGETYVDGTFGAGGYSRATLDRAPGCRIVGIDRDQTAHDRAAAWKDTYGDKLILLHGTFGNVQTLLDQAGIDRVQGFMLDIGVSSMQIDNADRGFSFRFDGPLDMRMDQSAGESAADIVRDMDETDLANLIYNYGEERHSRRIARAIVDARVVAPIETTAALASIVEKAMPGRRKPNDIHPATRTFQALRIAVNDELGELERALAASEHILEEGGRLVVVTFHSLEDRIVKNFFKTRSGDVPAPSRHAPMTAHSDHPAPTFRLTQRKAIDPTDAETRRNPRSRSAKLRSAIRTNAPAWNEESSKKFAKGGRG
ncbi:16S rRNA (cytosine(1402)-N(4))-methyltransferase RsmH [Micavibrio aeruginosavorus]|uniref:Ribosomal RNA small subunit methyltransferase H n=1 Tax=Micavibrio aeruginosavorus EPB TaxID=349215 RepID=M4VKK2_9BACT|nr:16S rRNA (cytosine(1402)-N(4))-methyltransferase RsmH [Micavibrio aeruginosavorus]AGH98621.1 rRNA small subunit methyltransferase H [Micavibrio aeruginosavorus EPB]